MTAVSIDGIFLDEMQSLLLSRVYSEDKLVASLGLCRTTTRQRSDGNQEQHGRGGVVGKYWAVLFGVPEGEYGAVRHCRQEVTAAE